MSNFIPNSFQTPNAYVDQFMHLLSGPEYKVLCYLVRRIFGFQKRQDRVSMRQITSGIRNREGDFLDHGTGTGTLQDFVWLPRASRPKDPRDTELRIRKNVLGFPDK